MKAIKKCGVLALIASSVIAMLSFHSSASALEMRSTFLKKCPTTDQPPANSQPESLGIPTAIAVSLAGSLVDAGMAMLKKTLVPEAVSIEGQFLQHGLFSYLSGVTPKEGASKNDVKTKNRIIPNPDMGCLVIAVGEFGNNPTQWTLPFADESISKDAIKTLNDAFALKKPPTLYFEAARYFSNDTSAVTWRPVKFYVGEYLANSFWAGKSRGIKIEMKLYAPTGDKPFLAQDFSFPEVTKPFESSDDVTLSGGRGAWVALPAPSSSSMPIYTEAGNPVNPFTLDIRIVESPKPYHLAQMFAEAAVGQKEAIKTEVKTVLDSQGTNLAKQDARITTLSVINDFVDLLDKLNIACKPENTSDEPGKFTCSIATDKASIAREKAQFACKVVFVNSCTSLPVIK